MTIDAQLRYIAACFAVFGQRDLAVTLRDASRAWRYESFADEQGHWREVFFRAVARFGDATTWAFLIHYLGDEELARVAGEALATLVVNKLSVS